MKKVLQKISIASVGLLTPAFVFAGTNGFEGTVTSLGRLLQGMHYVISSAIPVLIALGVLGFMWGIVLYLFGKNKEEGKMFMVWGIIALFVMTSVWGLVGILRGTLFSSDDNYRSVDVPQIR